MFVIYNPENRPFLRCVIPLSDTIRLDWDNIVHDLGILPTKEDAIAMAPEVQRIRATENIFHYSVQVLELGSNQLPNFKTPIYELSSIRKISTN